MSNILCPRLNERIIELTKSLTFNVADHAPNTFAELMGTESLTVWSGGSESTIYGAPEINWIFRAWHDSIHRQLSAPFTLHGEIQVAEYQANQLGDDLGRFILAEVRGQAEYFQKTGAFPVNQLQFMREYLGIR